MKFTARLLALGLTVSTAYGMEKEDSQNLRLPTAEELIQDGNNPLLHSIEILKKIEAICDKEDNQEAKRSVKQARQDLEQLLSKPLTYVMEKDGDISEKLGQTARNTIQAKKLLQFSTGVLDSSSQVLEKMQILAEQASSDTVGAFERAMLQEKFSSLTDQLDWNVNRAVWGDVKLFGGGAGTATAIAANRVACMSGNGNPSVANSINNAAVSNMVGFISGTVTDANAKFVGPNTYELMVQVGEQTFTATTTPSNGGSINFQGTVDRGNKFTVAYAAAVTGIITQTTFTRALSDYFQLGATPTATKFLSANIALPGTWTASTPGAGTDAGIWAVTYQNAAASGTGTFELTNGKSTYKAEVTTSAAMTQSVTFGNGFSITLAAFDGTAPFPGQVIYNVTSGTGVKMSFLAGKNSSDTISVNFTPASASALGLSWTGISTRSEAAYALTTISNAQRTLNYSIARLGAVDTRLDFILDTLKVISANQEASRVTFVDVDDANGLRFESIQ